jgi:hypothetical protein
MRHEERMRRFFSNKEKNTVPVVDSTEVKAEVKEETLENTKNALKQFEVQAETFVEKNLAPTIHPEIESTKEEVSVVEQKENLKLEEKAPVEETAAAAEVDTSLSKKKKVK